MKRVALLILVAVSFVSVVHAGDSKRKGWVSGVGIGYAPIAWWEAGAANGIRRGLSFNAMIGGAWDERNMAVLEANMSFAGDNYSHSFTAYDQNRLWEPAVQQGFLGVGWYHYYGSKKISFYTDFALGTYYFKVKTRIANSPGFAYQIGAGFALWQHTQLGAYLSMGNTSFSGSNFTHKRLDVLMSVIAF